MKRLDIYAQVISDVMKPSTHYVTNVECADATGLGIANSLLHELHSRGVESEKITSLGSDGASVMTGKHKVCKHAFTLGCLTFFSQMSCISKRQIS